MLERPRTTYAILRFILDIALTGLALYLASVVRPLLPFGMPLTPEQAALRPSIYVFVAVVWAAIFLLLGVYEARNQRAAEEAQAIFLASSLAALVLASLLYLTFRHISRLQFLSFYVLDVALLISARLIIRRGLRLAGIPRYARRKVLVLGAGEAGQDAIHMVESHRWAGLEPVGFLDDNIAPHTEIGGYPVLGSTEQVAEYLSAQAIDEVIVALPLESYNGFFRLLGGLQQLPARVRIVPDHIKTTLFRTRVEEFAGVPMITLCKPSLTAFERKVKRAFDLAFSTVMLVLIFPLMSLIAIAIRLDSKGPILFRQQRIGENGRLFWMLKFRSMIEGAERHQAETLRVTDDGQIVHKHRDDPRVTRLGALLRRASLDELPQLVNVIMGDMSMVGPRPELPWLVEAHYQPWQWQRFTVPQGITGWWQVNGRSDKPMHLHTEEDLFYIQHYSFLLDVQILWRTIGAALKSRGAY